MTVTEIAAEHGVSRVTIHTYRRRGTFPQPVEGEGTTRLRFRADEVAAFFAANPKQPGRRTDLPGKQQQGDPAVGDVRSGVIRNDVEDREQLLNTAELIEARWPGEHPTLVRDLRDLGDTITEEAQDG